MEDELKLRKVTLEINSEDIEHGIHNSCFKCVLGRSVCRVLKEAVGMKVFTKEHFDWKLNTHISTHFGVDIYYTEDYFIKPVFYEFELKLPKEFTDTADAWEHNHEEAFISERGDGVNSWNEGKWPDKFPITCEVEIPERFLR